MHTLMNSIGQTAHASTPPAMQPAVIAVNGLFDLFDMVDSWNCFVELLCPNMQFLY
jgi:hypothetical protein